MNPWLHTPVLILLVLSAFFALWFRNLLYSIVSLGAFSLTMSLEFYILRAPDVAIAEAAIGAALTTTIFILTLRACTPRSKDIKQGKGEGKP